MIIRRFLATGGLGAVLVAEAERDLEALTGPAPAAPGIEVVPAATPLPNAIPRPPDAAPSPSLMPATGLEAAGTTAALWNPDPPETAANDTGPGRGPVQITAGGPARPGPSRRILRAVTAGSPPERYEISYAGPQRPDRHPVTVAGELAALELARTMSAQGDRVDVARILGDGFRLPAASFVNRQLSPTRMTMGPRPDPDGYPHAQADVRGRAALPPGRPAGHADTPAGQPPAGTSPLPAATASGSPLRPHRLVYPDGTPLACRPAGHFGPAWTGTAAGVIPAPGGEAGWLQAVRHDDGSLHTMHPALIAPARVNPYALLRFRDQQRFSAFDPAEAGGRDAAWLYAALADQGDLIRVEIPPMSGIIQIRQVTGTETSRLHVRITTVSPAGDTRTDTYASRDRIEIILPARHPAEAGPYAARLFAAQAHPCHRTFNDGISLQTIRKRLGHRKTQTTLGYAEQSDITADNELRARQRRRAASWRTAPGPLCARPAQQRLGSHLQI